MRAEVISINEAIKYVARLVYQGKIDSSHTTIRCALNDLISIDYAQDRAVKQVLSLVKKASVLD